MKYLESLLEKFGDSQVNLMDAFGVTIKNAYGVPRYRARCISPVPIEDSPHGKSGIYVLVPNGAEVVVDGMDVASVADNVVFIGVNGSDVLNSIKLQPKDSSSGTTIKSDIVSGLTVFGLRSNMRAVVVVYEIMNWNNLGFAAIEELSPAISSNPGVLHALYRYANNHKLGMPISPDTPIVSGGTLFIVQAFEKGIVAYNQKEKMAFELFINEDGELDECA